MRATKDDNIFQVLGLEENYSTLEENKLQEYFYKIAKILFENYQIAKGNTRYDFEEIEFYLYTEKHQDNNHVYPRVCDAGEWFVHYSGVDLTFQTYIDNENRVTQCGGILIRRIKKVGEASVGGPLRCLMELFNGQDDPILVKKSHQDVVFDCTPRIGIKNANVQDEQIYRFVVNKNSDIETVCPQYIKDRIVVKEKKYKYEPKLYAN